MSVQKMEKVEVKTVGESTMVTIPNDVLTRAGMQHGDTVFLVETPDGILLSTHDAEVRRQVEVGIKFMDRYDETFKRLSE